MDKDTKITVAISIVLVIILALIAVIYGIQARECEVNGGILVRGPFGYICIEKSTVVK